MIEQLLDTQTLFAITHEQIVLNIALAFALSFVVAVVYRYTHSGVSYSQSFVFSLVLIGFLIAAVIMVIGNSIARAFGAFGVFSLIRFRTAIKDTKDVTFILLVVAIGLACGTGNYFIAIILTVFSLFVIVILSRIRFGSIRNHDYILNFSVQVEQFDNESLRGVFKRHLTSNNLINVIARSGGAVMDYSFNVTFSKTGTVESLLQDVKKITGVDHVDLLSSQQDVEY